MSRTHPARWSLLTSLLILFGVPGRAGPARAAEPAQGPQAPQPVPDAVFCGVEATPAATSPALSCKLPGLPCGPVPASRIGASGSEPGEDLDGDGQPDITLAGRRTGPQPAAYGVIYRSTPAGYVLADYQPVESRADPAVATVALLMKDGPPLIRDGYDLPLSAGSTLSMARLRRWDGQRFRTLLTFCAHRAEPVPDSTTVREGQNRVEFIDVDQDGRPEVVLSGLLRPRVFRFTEGGLGLREDQPLTDRYRENSPGEKKARALRAEATRLFAQGERRRAAAVLSRAHDLAPYNIEVTLQLATTLLKVEEPDRAVKLLLVARDLEPERPAIHCTLAEAYRLSGDDEEAQALQACLDRNPDPAQRKAAEERLKALTAATPAPPAAGPPAAP